jgi:hypothetical protein
MGTPIMMAPPLLSTFGMLAFVGCPYYPKGRKAGHQNAPAGTTR